MMDTLPTFEPAWWLPGAHGQTLGARFFRPKRGPRARRVRWDTPDGDFLDLDFVDENGLRDDVLVLLLHGLEGSARSGYILETARRLAGRSNTAFLICSNAVPACFRSAATTP